LSSQRLEIGDPGRNYLTRFITNLKKNITVLRIARDVASVATFTAGIYNLVIFTYLIAVSSDAGILSLFFLILSFVFFYLFMKLNLNRFKERDVFVYDNYFNDESKWKINNHTYNKYVSKRFRDSWRKNLLYAASIIASYIVLLSIEDPEGLSIEEELWLTITVGMASFIVIKWSVGNFRRNEYQNKMEQMVGGMNLSDGTLAFVNNQPVKLKAFASVELVRLISLGILVRVPEKKEGE